MKARLLSGIIFFLTASVGLGSGEPVTRVTLFFTGDVQGNFGPCGCEVNPSGGVSRRLAHTESFAAQTNGAIVQVDLGNYFVIPGPQSRETNELMVEGLKALPVRVLNLTPNDIYQWKEIREAPLPTRFISTNLKPRDSSAPAPELSAVITLAPGDTGLSKPLRIGFIGVTDPRKVKPNSGFRGEDPVAAAKAEVKTLADQVDLIVILADLPRREGPIPPGSPLYELAGIHPKVSAVLSTEKKFMLHDPQQIANAVVVTSIERGRYLGQLSFGLDSNGEILTVEPQYVFLDEKVGEKPDILRLQSRIVPR